MLAVDGSLPPSERDATDDVTERVGGRKIVQYNSLAEKVAENNYLQSILAK